MGLDGGNAISPRGGRLARSDQDAHEDATADHVPSGSPPHLSPPVRSSPRVQLVEEGAASALLLSRLLSALVHADLFGMLAERAKQLPTLALRCVFSTGCSFAYVSFADS